MYFDSQLNKQKRITITTNIAYYNITSTDSSYNVRSIRLMMVQPVERTKALSVTPVLNNLVRD